MGIFDTALISDPNEKQRNYLRCFFQCEYEI